MALRQQPVIFFFLLAVLRLLHLSAPSSAFSRLNSSVDPEYVVAEFGKKLESARRRAQEDRRQCLTGNPIDDCWRCSDDDWSVDRQRLADCGVGFGAGALGGKGGQIYVVTDPSDPDPMNPPQGTLRYGAIQDAPLWITFSGDMTIRLSEELLVNSFKTLDGRGAQVHIAGGACITLENISHVIIHNLHVHHCVPAGHAYVRSSQENFSYRTRSDGDGIAMFAAREVWIDHCSFSSCANGLVDAIVGSTAITVSNSYFSQHDMVMLLGHSDAYSADVGMRVTVALNVFGEGLVQRMPRCRFGYFHVANNDYRGWGIYAVGGSSNPTINSQGNRYIAPPNPNAKEVTMRMETEEKVWERWNWRTEGDVMVNGAFFVPSGEGLDAQYAMASSFAAKSVANIDQLTQNAGVFGDPTRANDGGGETLAGVSNSGGNNSGGDDDGESSGMIYSSDAEERNSFQRTIFTSMILLIHLCHQTRLIHHILYALNRVFL